MEKMDNCKCDSTCSCRCRGMWIVCAHVIGGVACLFILSALIMLLWNALLPELFGLNCIGYWQSMGLLVLVNLLFLPLFGCKSHGCHCGCQCGCGCGCHCDGEHEKDDACSCEKSK